mmetsp:Transcript_2837/g.6704  ORF Transcript_2837/g.6704 Transcript_2837/m.6704 type:complete len:283 (+) Transcript_2837:190-1038(+)
MPSWSLSKSSSPSLSSLSLSSRLVPSSSSTIFLEVIVLAVASGASPPSLPILSIMTSSLACARISSICSSSSFSISPSNRLVCGCVYTEDTPSFPRPLLTSFIRSDTDLNPAGSDWFKAVSRDSRSSASSIGSFNTTFSTGSSTGLEKSAAKAWFRVRAWSSSSESQLSRVDSSSMALMRHARDFFQYSSAWEAYSLATCSVASSSVLLPVFPMTSASARFSSDKRVKSLWACTYFSVASQNLETCSSFLAAVRSAKVASTRSSGSSGSSVDMVLDSSPFCK